MMKSFKFVLVASVAATILAAAPAYAQFTERSIRISNGVNEDHPNGKGVEKFKACLTDKSGGKLKVQGFWGNALGGDLQATQALRSGTQEMVVTSSSPLIGILPDLGVFDLPFLFANEKEADAVLDGSFGEYVDRQARDGRTGQPGLLGERVPQPQQFAPPGRKVGGFQGPQGSCDAEQRVPRHVQDMGANAVPMAFGEVFTALETKAIDGQENPFVTIDTSKFYEVQKYLSVTRHAYTPFLVLYSKKLWDGLSKDEQAALRDCAVLARDEQRKVSRELSLASLNKIKGEGTVVNELNAQEANRMRDQAKAVWEKHAATIGPETVKMMQAELEKVRQK